MAMLSNFVNGMKDSLYTLTKEGRQLVHDAWSSEAIKASIEARRRKSQGSQQAMH